MILRVSVRQISVKDSRSNRRSVKRFSTERTYYYHGSVGIYAWILQETRKREVVYWSAIHVHEILHAYSLSKNISVYRFVYLIIVHVMQVQKIYTVL
jgi:hypothetical protein